jgi:hypothetical protein
MLLKVNYYLKIQIQERRDRGKGRQRIGTQEDRSYGHNIQ